MRSSFALRRLSQWLRRLDQRGESSWITYVLLIGVVGGLYLLAAYMPLYLDNYEAKSKCEEVLAKTYKYRDEMKTRDYLKKALEQIAVEEQVEYGETKKMSAIHVDERKFRVEIDESVVPAVLRASLDYSRTVKFPFIKKQKEKEFHFECEITL